MTTIPYFPLTLAQSDIYFDQLSRGDLPLYNVGGYIRLPAIDVARLGAAHARLVMAHDAFGIRIHRGAEEPLQSVSAQRGTALPLRDFSGETAPREQARAWLDTLFATPLPVHDAELFSAFLIKLGDTEYWYAGLAHHLAMDGWGFANWARLLSQYYHDASGAPEALNAAEAAAGWQPVAQDDQAYLAGPRLQADRAYWAGRLADLPDPLLQRRTGLDEETAARSRRAILPLTLAQSDGLARAAAMAGVGMPQLLSGLLALYCYGATGRDRFVLGMPVHNRAGFQRKRMPGVFAGISLMPVALQAGHTLAQALQAIAAGQRADLRHQRYPLGRLLRDLGLQGGARRAYDAGFNYLKLDSELAFDGAAASLVYLSHQHEATPLMMTVWEGRTGEPLEIQFDYNLAYLDQADMARLVARFALLVDHCQHLLAQPLAAIDILAPGERDELIHGLNPEAAESGAPACLHALFEAQARATPDAQALVCGTQSLTYRALNERANQVAHRLLAEGCRPGALVGLCTARSLDMVAGMLAILKAGCAYVPLDPAYPPARLQYLLRDSAVSVVLAQTATAGLTGAPTVICLDQPAAFDRFERTDPGAITGVTPGHLAYVIYTSGSTGQPKGVAIRHRNAAALLQWARGAYTDAELRSVLASTSLNFDLSVFEIFVPLCLGYRCVIVRDALALLEQPCDVSLVNTVPSAMKVLLEQNAIPPSATVINLAGEPLSRKLLNGLFGHGGVRKVFNLYGPSEDTTYSTGALFTGPVDGQPGIGRALPQTALYVLSPRATLLPWGAAGELYISGAGVAQGYLNRPQLTAEKFMDDPFRPGEGRRMYRTGDLVRWLPDGSLAFLGRIDEQVKIRGFRIELGEIEAQLAADPAVREAVVVAAGEESERRLAAYVVPYDSAVAADGAAGAALAAHLRAHLGTVLPDYMVPAAFAVLERLPLSPNGKIDRKALPPAQAQPDHGGAPLGPTGQALAAIWQELLQLEQVGADANFFELGGHSLLLTRMIHAAHQRHGMAIGVQDVFQAPTVAALAERIDRQASRKGAALVQGGAAAHGPLSFAQQRIWLAERLGTAPELHNIAGRIRLPQPLQAEQLQAALALLVRHHAILRTRFELCGEAPRQVVEAQGAVALQVYQAGQADADGPEAVARLFAAHAAQVFDTARLPLFSVMAVQDGAQHTELQVVIHHIVADGWSMVRFFDGLLAACAAPHSMAAPQYSYLDYVAWQAGFLQGAQAQVQQQFWRDYLHQSTEQLMLPFQAPTPVRGGAAGALLSRRLPAAHADRLRTLARQARGSLFNVMHAALALLLSRLTGERDLNIGVPVTGRNLAGSEDILGIFLNNLPLRSRVDMAQPFDAFLLAQVGNAAAALAHQDLPFEKILEASGAARNADSTPLFQVFLNMLSLPLASDGRNLFGDAMDRTAALGGKFNFNLYVTEGHDGIALYSTFNEKLISRADAEIMLEQYCLLLDQVAEQPGRCCGDFLLRAGGAETLLPRLAAVQLPAYAAPLGVQWIGSVQANFIAVAERSPERLALECSGRGWTYGELHRISDAYCARLQALGVAPGDVVAVLTERSDALVIATLAILKAGAAFMMLSQTAPELRVLQQVQAVPPRCLVTVGRQARVAEAVRGHLLAHGCAELQVCADLQAAGADVPRRHLSGPDDLAYIAFTSGTEGKPKAIRGRHSSLTAFMPWMAGEFGLRDDDRFGMLSGLVHDPLQRDMFTPLCMGATLVVPLEEELAFSRLNGWLLDKRLTVLHLTPSLGTFLSTVCDRPVPSLRLGFFVGEIITTAHVRQFQQAAPAMRVINIYGSTETGRAISYHDAASYPAHADYCTDVLPIGTGIGNVQLLVLNERLVPCGVGELGQIAVRSPYMSLGYHDDEALTRSKFIRNPYTDRAGDMIYLTGDTGRYRRDGVVECLGRSDQQVKVRGFRVELPEIQVCLGAHPGVRHVAVVSRTNALGEVAIAAFVVTAPGHAPAPGSAELAAFLGARLPDYMIPSDFVFLDALPLNENGKLDQKRLPRLEHAVRAQATPPQDAEETELLALWQDLFKQETICVEADFFRIGGHSLLATQLLVRIERQFNVTLGFRDFFQNSSIRAVARHVRQARLANVVRRSDRTRRQMTL